ncbi:hypothetical protein Q5762_34670, partial [Streptomyces sp. P9(2023)]|uniref:hypothetical protein n=1 Tax=Streptomyces sp. P9(2023) TaxID=3064394 RepID=UPI0028F43D20
RASGLPGFRASGLPGFRASGLPGFRVENGSPVVLAPGVTADEQKALEAADYRVFHSTEALRLHIEHLRRG